MSRVVLTLRAPCGRRCRFAPLAAFLALGAGELAEEVFVDAAEDVFGFVVADSTGAMKLIVPMRLMSSPNRCLSRPGRA